jgi:hypothetical protein
LDDHHKKVSAKHADIMSKGNTAVQMVGGTKLTSLNRAETLLKHGMTPSSRPVGKGGDHEYNLSVYNLSILAPTSEGHLQEIDDHIKHLKNHPDRKVLLTEAKFMKEGRLEAHSWLLKHPHHATKKRELVSGVSDKARVKKIAEIRKEKLKVETRMKQHPE